VRSGFYRNRRDGSERLWFKPEDIEAMMEGELRKAGLYPSVEEPVVDVERFIARHLKAQLDQYGELEEGVLGQTEFYPGESPKIVINRNLTGAIDDDATPAGILGRWRATLAHEASHVVMHRVLFEIDERQQGLFNVEPAADPVRLMRCDKKNVLFRGGGSDWREVQANMGMAALLMPQAVFRAIAQATLDELGGRLDELVAGSAVTRSVIDTVAGRFAVSKQAAGIRLETLGFLSVRGQLALGSR